MTQGVDRVQSREPRLRELFSLYSIEQGPAHYLLEPGPGHLLPRNDREIADIFALFVEQLNGNDARAIVALRLFAGLPGLVAALGPEALRAAGSARDERAALVAALVSPETAIDPIESAALSGADVAREMLTLEGGVWGVQRVAAHLMISRQAVDKRVRRNQLLAVAPGDTLQRFPVWQFTPEGVLPGIDEVLAVLADRGVGVWGRLLFVLSQQDDMVEARPLDALRQGDREGVLRAARRFGDSGE